MLYLGANIKEYRIKKGQTQEQLAYDLGVTSQTISRWENGTTYPDIVMLPTIAEYFGITIDALMGYDKVCSTEEREIFFLEIKDLTPVDKIQRHRDMLGIYPNDVYLQFSLSNCLYRSYKQTNEKTIEREIYLLCNRILHSNQPGIQCGAIRTLALLSAENGDIEQAMKYVNELPSVYCGREILAEQILHKISFKKAIKKYLEL